MPQEIILPELGDDINKATIACFHCSVGDKISVGAELLDVVTDKASFTIESTAEGIIKEILIKKGEVVPIGHTLVRVSSE